MATTSFDQMLRASRLASLEIGRDDFRVDRSINITRPDRDRLVGKVKTGRAKSGAASTGGLSRLIDKRMPLQRRFGAGSDARAFAGPTGFDSRQRAIVKVHYFNHAGGGGKALTQHVNYIGRDGATRDDLPATEVGEGKERAEAKREAEARAQAHAAYLSRAGGPGAPAFYDGAADDVDGATRAETWARSDKRHFRVILSAENAAKLGDLPAYTREVMARAGAALGTRLQWIAVDHHDTDNPHTHIVIRGRRANGQDLILPKDFVKYGFRDIARDVATEWLGQRTAADERLALDREVTKHAPTRLDRMIAAQLPDDRTIRIARLASPSGDPSTTLALKARARELMRMGLSREVKRNVLAFEPDWRERLQSMELHLDIRKRIVRQRTAQRQVAQQLSIKSLTRGLLGR